jgi:hypothetical protein
VAAPPPARPVPPKAAAAAGSKGTLDVLAELEKIRRQTLTVPGAGAATATPVAGRSAPLANGAGEISREVKLSLRRADFARSRRFLVNLQVEDGDHQVVDTIRGLQVDIGDLGGRDRVVVHLNIALDAKE